MQQYLHYITGNKKNLKDFSFEAACNFNSGFVTLYLTKPLKFFHLITLPLDILLISNNHPVNNYIVEKESV